MGVYLGKNGEAVASGADQLPFISRAVISMVYMDWRFGATLGLVLAMIIFGRSKYSKALSRTCIVPGIFNINEPVIFGLPIVLNQF